ncbi:MAG: aminotransferase class I/II-fold pyridoxal phosphate-dependent enzyme [Candidatus Aenigmatarchaeota archaeon]
MSFSKISASERCKNLKSPLRDISYIAKKLEQEGKKVYYFNIGDPNRFDFDTPQHMKDALKHAILYANYYEDSEGSKELIEAIAKEESRKNGVKIEEDDIIVTQGVSEAMQFLLNAIIEPNRGDEILIPGPSYPPYIQATRFAGGIPVSYKLDENNDWEIDLDDLRKKINVKTKLICIINPNNPTGSVTGRKIIKEVLNIAGEFGIPVVSDEIYDELIFDNVEYSNLASLANDVPVIVMNGFSKNYLATGWRCGYIYFYDENNYLEEIKNSVKAQARQRLSACTPVMKACAKSFENKEHLKIVREKLKERAKFAYEKLNSINGISAVKPKGAFYIFPKIELKDRWKDDNEFVLDVLRNTGIVLAPGSGFGETYGSGHFRSIILPPIDVMDEAFTKLKKFIEEGE